MSQRNCDFKSLNRFSSCLPMPGWRISEILISSLCVIPQWQTSLRYKNADLAKEDAFSLCIVHLSITLVTWRSQVVYLHCVGVCTLLLSVGESSRCALQDRWQSDRLRVEREDTLMVTANQQDRREVLGQSVQPGHVQGTGHCPFPGQGHTPVRQREHVVSVK